jgi:hypothetical protein
MSRIIDTIRPGDVISSDLMNRIIAMLNDHDAKLAAGAAGGSQGQVITGFSPPEDVGQNVGKTLTVFGNFDFPLVNNLITVDGIPVASSALTDASSNLQLVFIIPQSIQVTPNTKKSVKVRVANSKGINQRDYLLMPAVAAAPDPTIETVKDQDVTYIDTEMRSEKPAVITGVNYATPAANNAVELVFGSGANSIIVQLTVDPSSSIKPSPQKSTLIVTCPKLTAAVGIPVGGFGAAVLRITATGASNPVTKNVSIKRMS